GKNESDEFVKAYALVLFLQDVLGVERVFEDAAPLVHSDDLPLLNLHGDLGEAVFDAAEVGEELTKETHGSSEELSCRGGFEARRHSVPHYSVKFVVNALALLPEVAETDVRIARGAGDQGSEGVDDKL